MTKFTVTETKTINVIVNKCICGNTPEVESHTGCAYSASGSIECECGLSMSVSTDSLGYDGTTLLSLAQECAHKWNRVMGKRNEF